MLLWTNQRVTYLILLMDFVIVVGTRLMVKSRLLVDTRQVVGF